MPKKSAKKKRFSVRHGIAKKALKAAKEIERIPMPTKREITETYKKGMQEAEELQKLLKPAWFVKDTDRKGRKFAARKPKRSSRKRRRK